MGKKLPVPGKAAAPVAEQITTVTWHIWHARGTKLETFQVRNVMPTWRRGERPNEAWFDGLRELPDGSKQFIAFPESAIEKGR